MFEAYEEKENRRVRRYYRLTEAGSNQLETEMKEWNRYSNAINLILSYLVFPPSIPVEQSTQE